MSTKGGPIIETYKYQLVAAGGFFSNIIVSWVNGDGSIGEGRMFYNPKIGGNTIDVPCARWGSFSYRDAGSPTRGNETRLLLDVNEPIPPQYKGHITFPSEIRLTRTTPFTNTYSLDFDGVDDYVSTSSKIIGSDITLSGWVNFNGSYSNFSAHFPMSITPSNTSVGNETLGRFYKDASTLQIAIQCFDNTGANFSTYYVHNTTLEGAGWQHICLTYNVTTKHIYAYLNGVAQNWVKIFAASTPVPFLTAVSTRLYESDLTIGRLNPATSTGSFLGLVDEVSTYDKILTQAEITALYNSGTPTDLTSLSPIAWYRFEEGSGTTAKDSGSGGNDGTLINGPTYSTDVP